MTYDALLSKYMGRKLRPGQPSGFFWYRRKDCALWQAYYLDSKPKEIHLKTFVRFDPDGVVTGIDPLEASVLVSEGPRCGSLRSRKPTRVDFDQLDAALSECIEK